MFENVWTEDEKELLFTKMSDEEIAEKTGRSKTAVRKKRYNLTGHYVEEAKQKIIEPLIRFEVFDDNYKEARILALAKRLGVKLYG